MLQPSRHPRGWFFVLVLLLGLVVDQATKWLALMYAGVANNPIVIWPGVFRMQYLLNHGLAFSLKTSQLLMWVLIVVALMVLVVVVARLRIFGTAMGMYGLALLLAGALGNVMDRVLVGGVQDFLQFFLVSTLNVADLLIGLGVMGIAVASFRVSAK